MTTARIDRAGDRRKGGSDLRRNQLGGQIGTDPIFSPTSHTGGSLPVAARDSVRGKLVLTDGEREMLSGALGTTTKKCIGAIVDYGEIFAASRLVPLDGAPHLALSWGSRGVEPLIGVYRELSAADLKTYAPFTADPRPSDPVRLPLSSSQAQALASIYSRNDELERLNLALGLRDSEAWSCTSFEPEMGNIPEYGDYLAWSESSAIVYVNSVIGARSNRNPIGIDMLCNIVGKAPYFGLMTDRGRQATSLIAVKTSTLPNPQMLGSAIGSRVMDGVPFITGLSRFIDRFDATTGGFLKDLGAAFAAIGGGCLFHIDGLTPEACRFGRDLLRMGYATHVIDDAEIDRVHSGEPNLWKNRCGVPKRVFLGCPHLTVEQMVHWGGRIVEATDAAGTSRIGIPTYLFGSPHVRRAFEKRHPRLADRLRELGVSTPANCPMMWSSTPLEDAELVATNSSKTRTYTTARFFPDDILIELIVSGELPERARKQRSSGG